MLDHHKALLFMLSTHLTQALPEKMALLLSELQALFPGELSYENSKREGYEFLALHFSWYNRYSESVS
jgi:hypothetical protein